MSDSENNWFARYIRLRHAVLKFSDALHEMPDKLPPNKFVTRDIVRHIADKLEEVVEEAW